MNERAREHGPDGTRAIVGLTITAPADRRLLIEFLEQSGYEVRTGPLWELAAAARSELCLILADEGAARAYGRELLALKAQCVGLFLPMLILLPAGVESAPWLRAGFDDVLRVPVRQAELTSRLQVYLQLRWRLQDLAAQRQAEVRLNQDKTELERRVADRTGELTKANAELRRLTHRIVQSQEAEREHLARELHDEIGQALTAVNFNLQAFQHLVDDPTMAGRLQESLNIIESTLQQARDLSLDLHPAILDTLGLAAALEWYLERQTKMAGLTFELVADPPKMDLPPDLKTTCFRIVQEALTNVMRHAQAKRIQVDLVRRDGELELTIRDDGSGFSVQTARRLASRGASLGLLGMEERVRLLNGQLEIKSSRGRGTEIRARFPLAPAAPVKPPRERRKRERT